VNTLIPVPHRGESPLLRGIFKKFTGKHQLAYSKTNNQGYKELDQTKERFREITELNRSLANFGIQFSDLIDPSQNNTNYGQKLFQIGKILAEHPNLMSSLVSTKMLPIKQFLQKVNVCRGIVENNSKYIIAISLIYHGPYPLLRRYLQIP
jgi:RNA polymerase sigma factor